MIGDTQVRKYRDGDHEAIARIYFEAIHELAGHDYSKGQLDAWAGAGIDPDHWRRRCEKKRPFVSEAGGRVAGFIELDPDGHIDCAYVDPAFARRGVMSEIMVEVKEEARKRRLPRLFAEVSRTARPFFERHGFEWVRDNEVDTRGVTVENFIMECAL